MDYIKWNVKLNLGVPTIDSQHRTFAESINSLCSSNCQRDRTAALENTIYTLISYAQYHFKTEEDLMSQYNYPEYDSHVAEHNELMDRLLEFQLDIENVDPGVEFEDFLLFLKNWFLRHTQGTDRAKIAFYKSAGVITTWTGRKGAAQQPDDTSKVVVTPLIPWHDSYNLEIASMNEDIKNLVKLINVLYSTIERPDKAGVTELTLKELHKYTDYHFEKEEELMSLAGYPGLAAHRIEHRKFRLQIANIRNRFMRYHTVVDFGLMQILKRWFLEHTQIEDRKYVPWVLKETTEPRAAGDSGYQEARTPFAQAGGQARTA